MIPYISYNFRDMNLHSVKFLSIKVRPIYINLKIIYYWYTKKNIFCLIKNIIIRKVIIIDNKHIILGIQNSIFLIVINDDN